MTSTNHRGAAARSLAVDDKPYARRWAALVVLALVQFMLSIDMTVVNVALPSIQHDLGFSSSGLAWVVNSYTLMAGGFLLLGGRLADLISRKQLFIIGLVLFAGASLLSGLAPNPATLVTARFVQGLGVALVSPAALSLAVLMFTDAKERAKAIGIWGGLSGAGGTFGVVIGGVVTSAIDWRWIFLINLPIAAAVLVVSPRLIPDTRPTRQSRLDPLGAVLITSSLILIVFGLLNASDHGWGATPVWVPLAAGCVLLIGFAVSQALVRDPLIPLRFFRERTRATANIATVLGMASFMAMFYVLTLYMQDVGHYSPLKAGLAYLPFGIAMMAGVTLSTRVLPRLNIKLALFVAFLCCAGGDLILGPVGNHMQYAACVLPATLLYGFGQGIIFPALRFAALHRTGPAEVGLASGVQNTTTQVGGSLGLAVLVTLALRHATAQIAGGADPYTATVAGYALSFRIGSAVMVVGALLVLFAFEHISAASAAGARNAGPSTAAPSESSR